MREFTINILDIKEVKEFMDCVHGLPDAINESLGDVFRSKEGKMRIDLTRKKPGTCFNEPNVPWENVKKGDKLWKKCQTYGCDDWFPIVVTLKYGGVIFYRWLEGPYKGKLEHFELRSLTADLLVYPYKYIIPRDVELCKILNPKQIYEYIKE